ncbi:MAG: calcium-translocating P-type ATPase, SERCA-type [Tissierellia bacterium]|nr:calcium-translocating P-type ATPase, SERCA-type [Tissierellia bacterium]
MWHNKTSMEVLASLNTYAVQGLSNEEVAKRQEEFGWNELREKKKRSFLQKFLDQFKDFLIVVLLIAAAIEFVAKEYVEAVVILAIVILNALLSLYQEGQAEKSLESLKKMSAPEAKVLRDGKKIIVPARDIVPGDIVILDAGDIVPADIRLITTSNMKIDESSLTGESVAVEKDSESIGSLDANLGDRTNMAYMSSIVTYGRGSGVVVETGHNTEIGKIATQIEDIKDELTPLQEKLEKLGKILGYLTIGVCAIVFILGLIQKREILHMLLVSVSLAVAAIPEGLPAIVTIVLSIGMNRMVRKNAIVKKLLAVETLGSTTVICSDKTGTLTQNEMTVTRLYANHEFLEVTGKGYEPKGEILKDGKPISKQTFGHLKALFYASILDNDAELSASNNLYSIIGDPTEGALLTLAGKMGFTKEEVEVEQPRIDELPFDSERKMMSTFHTTPDDSKVVQYVKGAPDIVLSRSKYIYTEEGIRLLEAHDYQRVEEANLTMAKDALRVLGYAFKMNQVDEDGRFEKNEDDLIFIGLTGMIDPPREEAKDAIALCKDAGIDTVMITGDYQETAFQIAKELGIVTSHEETISGQELSKLSDEEYLDIVKRIKVYSRVSPEQKVKIVQALRQHDDVVAMTGDGVNDALALKRSDIGISMGITGTDVAKNTADVVLTDDNFASIVHAVEEGRIIFANIQKFVLFLLSCNIGEILLVFFAMVFGWQEPLKPIHLLWLNLITDSLPALALGVEPGEPGIMKLKPRSKNDAIINTNMTVTIVLQSIAIAAATLISFNWALNLYPDSITHARTIVFSTLILSELLRAFSSRSLDRPLWEIGLLTNKKMISAVSISFSLLLVALYIPFMQTIFDTFALGWKDWRIVVSLAIVPFIVGELYKVLKNLLVRK